MNCKECLFVHKAGLNAYVCGRYPPTIFGAAQGGAPVSGFPPVHPESHCGEWKRNLRLSDTVDLTDTKN